MGCLALFDIVGLLYLHPMINTMIRFTLARHILVGTGRHVGALRTESFGTLEM